MPTEMIIPIVCQKEDFTIHNLMRHLNKQYINGIYHSDRRWGKEKQSAFIETILMRLPVQPLYFAQQSIKSYNIIDGHQRIIALSLFFHDILTLTGLELNKNLNNLTFNFLPHQVQQQFTAFMITCNIFKFPTSQFLDSFRRKINS